MPSREGGNGSKIPKTIDIASTGCSISAKLDNKPRQKYGLFDKLSLLVIGVCELANNPHIFITRANQHIQEINRHFDVTLYHFCPMVFSENQEQNKSYNFKDMLLQPSRSDFILSTIKEVEAHEHIINLKVMKKSELNNIHKNKDGKLKTILSIWYFKRRILPDGRLTKHKSRLCSHGRMEKLGG